jgi:hypothetical protein
MQLKRLTVTHICCLITGDRFYLVNDKNKKVWELIFHTNIKFRNKQMKLSICKDDNSKKAKFNANRVVVFVRSTNPKRQPGYKKPEQDYLNNFFIH